MTRHTHIPDADVGPHGRKWPFCPTSTEATLRGMQMCLSELEMGRDGKGIRNSGLCGTALSAVSSVLLAGAPTGIWYVQKVRAAEMWVLEKLVADPLMTHMWYPRRGCRRSLLSLGCCTMANLSPVWMKSVSAAAAVAVEAFTRVAPGVAAGCRDSVVGASRAAAFAVHLMADAVPARSVPTPVAARPVGPVPAPSGSGSAPGVLVADRSPVVPVNGRVGCQIVRKRRQHLSLGMRIMVINAHETGDSYARIQETLALETTRDALRKTVERKQYYREAAAYPWRCSTGTVCAAVNTPRWTSGSTFGSAC